MMTEDYTATYATATGYYCLTSGAARLGAILVNGSVTGGFQLFTSATATAATAITGVVTCGMTGALRLFELNLNSPTGFCYLNVPSADPKLTLFWRPA